MLGQDSIPGFYPRWHISFNITMLRLLSFNMDYYWASKSTISGEVRMLSFINILFLTILVCVQPSNSMTHKQRIATSHPMEVYSFAHFLAYVLYPPLYIAGPIMTFNDFMWQVCTRSNISTATLLM